MLYQFPFEYVTLEDKQVDGYSSKRALYEFCFWQPWYLFKTCAVDAFLEISVHLFLPYLSNLRTRNGFTDLLFNVCSHYMSSRKDSSLLKEIREHVWSNIIDLCSSFAARDCNACFSQIFEKRTFCYVNEDEENLFMTQRTFDSFCRSCSSSVTLNSSILLTVVTAYGLNQLGLDNNMWPIFVTQMHTNPGRLNCTNCGTQTSEPVLRNVLNLRFLFIEFSPALMKYINVFEDIEISGAQYKLRGVVRCHNITTLLVLLKIIVHVNGLTLMIFQ